MGPKKAARLCQEHVGWSYVAICQQKFGPTGRKDPILLDSNLPNQIHSHFVYTLANKTHCHHRPLRSAKATLVSRLTEHQAAWMQLKP